MEPDTLLAFDIGTQSSRAALFDFSGNILASSSQTYELENPAPGWAQQDARAWWITTIHNIRAVLERSSISPQRIAAIAACGQMHALIPVDAQGTVLLPAVQLWCDKRSARLIDESSHTPEIAAAYTITGNVPAPSWLGWKIKWMKLNQPEVYHKAARFLTSSAYITYQLTGGKAVIDHSEASGSFLMDAQTHDWSKEMFAILDLDPEKLPAIMASSQVAGVVSAEAARLTGLAAGTPVAVGAGDMLATLLASGLTQPGRVVDITGTSSILCFYVNEPFIDPRLMNLHHVMPGWVTFGIIDSGGGSLKWFKDTFCADEIASAKTLGISPYQIMDQQAARIEPGSEGVLFLPYLLGERTLGSPYSRGVFFGLTPSTGKAAMTRAILSGVAFEMRRTLEIVQNTGLAVDEIRLVGGGAQSGLWAQIKADIFQTRIAILKNYEGGCLGAAILAGVGVGVFSSEAAAAERLVQIDHHLKPDASTAGMYNQQYEVFKEVHDRMIEPFQALARIR